MAVDYRGLIMAHPAIQSYWRLGETSGTTAADEKGVANGTHSGSPTLGSTGIVGADGNLAATYSGSQKTSMGDVYDFSGVAPFSVECWVKAATAASPQRLVAKESGALVDGWELQINASPGGVTLFRVVGSVSQTVATSVALSSTIFHHVVSTFTGAGMTLYIDGLAASNASDSRSLANTAAALTLGDRDAGGRALTGVLDEVAIYNAALSASDVAVHYAVGSQTFGALGASVPTTGQIWPRGSKA